MERRDFLKAVACSPMLFVQGREETVNQEPKKADGDGYTYNYGSYIMFNGRWFNSYHNRIYYTEPGAMLGMAQQQFKDNWISIVEHHDYFDFWIPGGDKLYWIGAHTVWEIKQSNDGVFPFMLCFLGYRNEVHGRLGFQYLTMEKWT